jgi:hypothetical protein
MTDCLNEEMRDLLPLLAHGSLAGAEADRVRAHVASCAACGVEFATLETSRLVLLAGAPKVDAAAIALGVTRAVSTAAPTLRVERGGASVTAPRRSVWQSRHLLAAAASLLIVASLSLRLLDRTPSTDDGLTPVDPVTVAAVDSPATAPASTGGISVGASLMDLSSDDLSILLDEIERVDATITLEPATMRQPIVDAPETL